MTEHERLIKLLDERIAIQECSFSPDKPLTTDSLADYLLEHGVIVPPCKVGAAVWCIVTKKSRSGLKFSYIKKTRMRWSNIERIIEGFGVTAFYTREEAEAAMAERR